jgi:hypothetical protein
MEIVLKDIPHFKNLDYIFCWYKKAADFVIDCAISAIALVSTNSICQGSQLFAWKYILKNLEIFFAYKNFKWLNNAKCNAGVTCVIIGISHPSTKDKFLTVNGLCQTVKKISYDLTESCVLVSRRTTPLTNLPKICFGSMPNDNGLLILDPRERENLIQMDRGLIKCIKRLIGSKDFINGQKRFCLWFNENNYKEFEKLNPIRERFNQLKLYRESSSRKATQKLASQYYAFGEVRHINANSILIPSTTSERREYIPIGYFDKDSIINNSCHVVYGAPIYLFGIISSRMHMTWAGQNHSKSVINTIQK